MPGSLYDYGYGVEWKDFFVQYREGYFTSVSDFHKHGFYEINLILSGNVTILLSDKTEKGKQNRIVLTAPGTPHYISCNSDTLYSRLYLLFSEEFLEDLVPEWKKLITVFGKNGRTVTITEERTEFFAKLIADLKNEKDRLRQKLIILYILSHISELVTDDGGTDDTPQFIMTALTYIEEHYGEKIVAKELAKKLYVSRTTFMTAFKKHTGTTFGSYLAACRLKNAARMLALGKTEYETAALCGFCDSCGMIRCFRRHFGMTPRQYISKHDK